MHDNYGRVLILDAIINSSDFLLINFYNANTEREQLTKIEFVKKLRSLKMRIFEIRKFSISFLKNFAKTERIIQTNLENRIKTLEQNLKMKNIAALV